jgi:ribose transport system substrate-binding protein
METAVKVGATLDVYDAKFDAAVQVDQIESAIKSGRYNAFIVCPLDPLATTPILKEAINEKEVLVAVVNAPIGGRELCEGDDVWEPGTVTFVGGQTHDVYLEWIGRSIAMAKEACPEGGEVAAITGPKVGANGKNMDVALANLLPGTGIELVANEETDYTTAEGYQKAREVLASNPDLRFIFSNYSGMTEGIVRAVRQAGLQDQVRISDFGGSRWALNALRRGEIEMTAIMLPYTESEQAVRAVFDHSRGREVPRFINLTDDPSLAGDTFVTRDNVDRVTAQYG